MSSSAVVGCDTCLVGLLGCMEPLSFAWTGKVLSQPWLRANVTSKDVLQLGGVFRRSQAFADLSWHVFM